MSKFKFQELPPEKLAWLAGMFQSEAQFYQDARTRAEVPDPEYVPPPPVPMIKIEMIEQDVMEHIGECVEQKAVPQRRQTSAGNKVYRVNLTAREKVKAFLEAILPDTYGQKKRGEILELLELCQAYDQWLAQGGRRKAAQHAARVKALRDPEQG